jgi:hypothetical protein
MIFYFSNASWLSVLLCRNFPVAGTAAGRQDRATPLGKGPDMPRKPAPSAGAPAPPLSPPLGPPLSPSFSPPVSPPLGADLEPLLRELTGRVLDALNRNTAAILAAGIMSSRGRAHTPEEAVGLHHEMIATLWPRAPAPPRPAGREEAA